MDSGLFDFWLRFGSVTGFFKPAPSPKPRQKSKILAAHRYIISVNALALHRRRLRRSSKRLPDEREQFAVIDWLLQVGNRPGLNGASFVFGRVAATDHDDGSALGIIDPLQPCDDFKS